MILWNQTDKKPFDPQQPTPPEQPFQWIEPTPLPPEVAEMANPDMPD
jgi:hypothetical protein